MKPENAEVFVSDKILGGLFEDSVNAIGGDRPSITLIENYITSDLVGLMTPVRSREGSQRASTSNGVKGLPAIALATAGSESLGGVTGHSLADLVNMIKAGELSSRGAKDTLAIMYAEGGEPKAIAEKNGFIQKNDIEELKKIVAEVITSNPAVVADYKSGKVALLQFFIGQGMKASKGSGNPAMFKTLSEEALK